MTNKIKAFRRTLLRKGTQERFHRHGNYSVGDECYYDAMDAVDSLIGIRIPDPKNSFNFMSLSWAINSKFYIYTVGV